MEADYDYFHIDEIVFELQANSELYKKLTENTDAYEKFLRVVEDLSAKVSVIIQDAVDDIFGEDQIYVI